MKKIPFALLAGCLALPGHAGSAWDGASDALAAGLPALAAFYTYRAHDTEGGLQLAWGLGATLGSAQVLKTQVHAVRPDRSDDKSFPSGHTAVAFASARYIDKRYTGEVNPYLLYGAASLTALARVQANKHYWRDTAAGAALGYAWAEYFTETRTGARLSLLPAQHGWTLAWQQPW